MLHKLIIKTTQYKSLEDINNYLNPRERRRLIDDYDMNEPVH